MSVFKKLLSQDRFLIDMHRVSRIATRTYGPSDGYGIEYIRFCPNQIRVVDIDLLFVHKKLKGLTFWFLNGEFFLVRVK